MTEYTLRVGVGLEGSELWETSWVCMYAAEPCEMTGPLRRPGYADKENNRSMARATARWLVVLGLVARPGTDSAKSVCTK